MMSNGQRPVLIFLNKDEEIAIKQEYGTYVPPLAWRYYGERPKKEAKEIIIKLLQGTLT